MLSCLLPSSWATPTPYTVGVGQPEGREAKAEVWGQGKGGCVVGDAKPWACPKAVCLLHWTNSDGTPGTLDV